MQKQWPPDKPFGSLKLRGEMPRRKTEDQAKIEKILREEQDELRERELIKPKKPE